jgi:hypothetical protein
LNTGLLLQYIAAFNSKIRCRVSQRKPSYRMASPGCRTSTILLRPTNPTTRRSMSLAASLGKRQTAKSARNGPMSCLAALIA